jgi:cation diffusion facilitator family transporter
MEPSNKRAIFVSFAVNICIALAKLAAAALTRSAAMLAEGIHTVADTSHELFLLLGVHQSNAPEDGRFPYGQGKAVYFWGFVAVLVFLMGGLVTIKDGVEQLRAPQPFAWVAVACAILAVSMVLNGVALREALQQFMRTKERSIRFVPAFKQTKDPSMRLLIIQNALDIFGEGLAFTAILLSQFTRNYRLDGLASVTVGLLLVGSALWQASRIKDLLIGQSADEEVVQGIRGLVELHPAVRSIQELLTLHMGPNYVLVNLRVEFDESLTLQDIEVAVLSLERHIQESFPIAKRVYVRPVVSSVGLRFPDGLFRMPNPVAVRERVE